MKNKRTMINMAANIVSYGTTIIISFFMTPYLINTLGKDAYSFYPIANNFVNYISIVTVALNSMASRYITIEIVKNDRFKTNQYFSSIFYSNVALLLILSIPMILAIVFLESFLNIPIDLVVTVKTLFALVYISLAVSIITSVFGVAAFAANRLDLTSVMNIIVAIARIILYLILFSLFKPTIVYVGIVGVAVALITFGFQYVFTKKLFPFIKISRLYFDFKCVVKLLASGIWNSINNIGGMLMSGVGMLLCNILISTDAGGDYSVVQTVPNFINGIIGTLTAVFLPVITYAYAKGNKELMIEEVKTSQRIMGALTNVPIAVFIAMGENFFDLWTPSLDSEKLVALSFMCIIHLIFTGVLWPVANLNTVLNKVKQPAIIFSLFGVLNIISILFLHKYTSLGIYSIAVTQMILNILYFGFFNGIYQAKCLEKPWYTFYPAVVKAWLGAVIIFSYTYILNKIMNPVSWLPLIVQGAFCSILGVAVNIIMIWGPLNAYHMIAARLKPICGKIHKK